MSGIRSIQSEIFTRIIHLNLKCWRYGVDFMGFIKIDLYPPPQLVS